MKTLYSDILHSLQQGNPLVAITIIEQHGSAPRTAGAKMLVKPKAPEVSESSALSGVSIVGTVGGGLYEAKVIELAKELFAAQAKGETRQALMVSFDLQGKHTPTDMDMICGGALRLFVEYIPVSDTMLALYASIVQAETARQACTIITRIKVNVIKDLCYDVISDTALYALDTLSCLSGTVHLPEPFPAELLACTQGTQTDKARTCLFGNDEYIIETLHAPYTLHIFGAGHVSCELVKITDYLDFINRVMDDRADFANTARFPQASPLVLPSLDYSHIKAYFNELTIGKHDGIVIITRGHVADRDVLAASLETKASYIGMIGSKSKRQATYDYLIRHGHDEASFTRIHSPIGVSIGAQTPQEIAISIAAELIQWRAAAFK